MIQNKNISNKFGGCFLLSVLLLVMILQFNLVSADMQVVEYNITSGGQDNAQFQVQTLKYEPYPVNAGDWFDLWVKVQNIGVDDANDARFELLMDYPFSSNDTLVREYGLVPGTSTAFKHKQLGDKDIQANQVIMKFRVKVADNAPEGENLIKLQTSADGNEEFGLTTYSLPIEVAKTKTSFDIVMQDSTSQGTSFAIANVGDKDSTAVTFTIPEQDNVEVTGPSSSIIGNLEEGDFTTVTFKILPNKDLHELKIELAYTDSAGVRNVVTEMVPVSIDPTFGQQTQESGGFSFSAILWLIIGAVLGIFGNYLYKKRKKKKE